MKKSRKRVNKSREIREYRRLHRQAMPLEIVAALAERGIKVTAPVVSTTLYNAKKLKKRRGRRKVTAGNGRLSTRRAMSVPAEMLLGAKKLADDVGGVDNARSALSWLEKLQ